MRLVEENPPSPLVSLPSRQAMLPIEQHHVPKEAALFVMSLVKAARRALLSAEGYRRRAGPWRSWISGWKTRRTGWPYEPQTNAASARPRGGRADPGGPDP